jgi:uncharacterized RDD family membrane protein YckC
MAVATDQAARRLASREVVVEFSPEAMRAPFGLRCVAIFIDYILVIAVPVLGLLFELATGSDPAKTSNNVAWLIAFLLGISDLIIFPALSGQTLGKMICGLRIVRKDGTDASVQRILLRNSAGYLLTILTGLIGFLIAVVTPNGRALHDYMAGTMVVFGKKRVLK